MNKYNLNCYKKPFVLKNGNKVYPKINIVSQISGSILLALTIVTLTILTIIFYE